MPTIHRQGASKGVVSVPTIGIFGANGFIGRAAVRFLVAQGRRVVAFGRAFPADYGQLVGGPVETRLVDFREAPSVQGLVRGIDQVVDLVNASSPALGNGRVVEDAATDVLPHLGFIRSCVAGGVSRILFLSSGGTVYGTPRHLPIGEDHPTDPLVSYGAAKLMVEHYLRMLTRNTATDPVILRVANPFGPGQGTSKGQGLVAAILERHAAGLPVTIYGDGGALRDYLFIDDLCEAVAAALDTPALRQTFNIGTGHGRSTLDVVRALEAALECRIPLVFTDERVTDTRSNVLDCRKAALHLPWSARTPFAEGIRRTVSAAGLP